MGRVLGEIVYFPRILFEIKKLGGPFAINQVFDEFRIVGAHRTLDVLVRMKSGRADIGLLAAQHRPEIFAIDTGGGLESRHCRESRVEVKELAESFGAFALGDARSGRRSQTMSWRERNDFQSIVSTT